MNVSKYKLADLPPVSRTLLIPLAYRALESQRPDALVCDPRAVALVRAFDEDFSEYLGKLSMDQATTIMRVRQFDREARTFLDEDPDGVVVDIGCGLNTRFDRIDNGRMDWYGLDLPEVIDVYRTLLPLAPRGHLIACSALDHTWLDQLAIDGRAVLFLAEGVFPFFEEAQVRALTLALRDRFPGSLLVFDAVNTFSVRMHNATHPGLKKAAALLRWALEDNRAPEARGAGIKLLGEWEYFNQGEPRLGLYNLMRFIPPFARANRILRYRLGERSESG
jgi:O-methyltransferase involved in polyketide biosynthesis